MDTLRAQIACSQNRAGDAPSLLLPTANGVEARARALLSEGEAAERLYGEAIARLSPTRVRAELGRAHLLFGEWLRRERRRLDARDQLRTPTRCSSGLGVEAFAERRV